MLNVPNGLTMTRCIGSPLIWLILAYEEPSWMWVVGSTLVFVFLCATDFLDGYFARKLDQRTAFGEWLDPIADKILVMVTIAALFVYHYHELSFFVIIAVGIVLVREICVIIAREYLRRVGETIPTIWAAKVKTGVQMTGLGFMVIGGALDTLLPLISDYLIKVNVMGESIFIIGAGLGFYSAAKYSKTTFAIVTRKELSRRR